MEHKNRVYKEEVMEAITMLPEKQLDKKNSLILIKACSSFLVNESPKGRMFLLDKLLSNLGYFCIPLFIPFSIIIIV